MEKSNLPAWLARAFDSSSPMTGDNETMRTMDIEIDGKMFLIPTIRMNEDGELYKLGIEEAIEKAKELGDALPVPEGMDATEFSKALSDAVPQRKQMGGISMPNNKSKIEQWDEDYSGIKNTMTETEANRLWSDLEKSKDMSIEEKSDFALQRLEEESAARKRYDEMTQIWITDYTKMSEEEKNAFITEYMALRENYSFDKKNFAKGGAIMASRAQRGQANLPMKEATSAPQGGGPKAGNPATLMPPPPVPQPKSGPGGDPRDEAIQLVMQQSQKKNLATPPAPVADGNAEPADLASIPPMPPILEGNAPPAQGLGAADAQQPAPAQPLKRGGEPTKDKDGMSVVIGLGGSPMPEYEDASMGTPQDPPPGATPDEVADDKHVLMSEGELVVPANVVRYHGLGTYEGLRREALMGLSEMEQSGQINYDNGIQKAQAGLMMGNANNKTTLPQTPTIDYRNDPFQVGANPPGYMYNYPPTIGWPPFQPFPPFNPYLTNPNQRIVAPNVGEYKNIINPTDDEDDAPVSPPEEIETGPAPIVEKPDPREDATSPESMAQAKADRERSYDGAVNAAIAAGMKTDEEIRNWIQSGNAVNVPGLGGKLLGGFGWAFDDKGISNAVGRWRTKQTEFEDTHKDDSLDIEQPERIEVVKGYSTDEGSAGEKEAQDFLFEQEHKDDSLDFFQPEPEPEREKTTVTRDPVQGTTVSTPDREKTTITTGTGGKILGVNLDKEEKEEKQEKDEKCVIATHGIETGGFSPLEKAKAEIWCAKTYHGKWYGEAFRRGYRYLGTKHVEQGTASQFYNEFKDFVAFGRGLKKGLKVGLNYYFRTLQFFITGLFVSKDV